MTIFYAKCQPSYIYFGFGANTQKKSACSISSINAGNTYIKLYLFVEQTKGLL